MRAKPQFDSVYRFYDAFMRVMGLYREGLIVKMLSLEGTERVLDLGGGTGWVARHLAPHCGEIYVLDESPGMLSRAARYAGIHVVKGDALDTPFLDSYFDVVVLTDVLHHIADQTRLIEEARRILKPESRLLIYDFDTSRLRARLVGRFEAMLLGTSYFRTRGYIEDLVLSKGFRESVRVVRGHWFIIVWKKYGQIS